jgi:hypothetical protein
VESSHTIQDITHRVRPNDWQSPPRSINSWNKTDALTWLWLSCWARWPCCCIISSGRLWTNLQSCRPVLAMGPCLAFCSSSGLYLLENITMLLNKQRRALHLAPVASKRMAGAVGCTRRCSAGGRSKRSMPPLALLNHGPGLSVRPLPLRLYAPTTPLSDIQ